MSGTRRVSDLFDSNAGLLQKIRTCLRFFVQGQGLVDPSANDAEAFLARLCLRLRELSAGIGN